MKYGTPQTWLVILLTAVLWSPAIASTGSAAEDNQVVFLMSRTDMSSVTDAELAGIYREADASLVEQVREGLVKGGMRVFVVQSEKEILAGAGQHVLLVKVDKIELGGKRPFGRTAKVKVAYNVQNKDRFDLVKRTHEETSASKWQNCVKKISEQLVADVRSDIVRYAAGQKAEDRKDAVRKAAAPEPVPLPASAPTASSPEARLQQLESLKGKGLISQEEYDAKRKAILKDL